MSNAQKWSSRQRRPAAEAGSSSREAVSVRLEARPFDFGSAREISEELGLRLPVAITLVRRGCEDVPSAARFLAADEWHDPSELPGAVEIAEGVAGAIGAGRRITVFGDFDADGVCATAILVGALRKHGAECDWLIPDRLGEGYGLGPDAVERLAARGTELLITVDNGIAAAGAIDEAKARGMGVIVTDHHRPGERLPDCPILHPGLAGYSCPDLCGAAVAWKLAQAVDHAVGDGTPDRESDLDAVALATVADLVPLRGENRAIARRGLEVARRGERPGLRALAEVASCAISKLDEGDLGFRLAPRINAAGRLYRADAGVELLLTEDEDRAREIANELDRANRERRTLEDGVARDAAAARAGLPAEIRDGAALVVWGRDWHPGVIGIVASRLVEEHGRPAVVISVDADGRGRGSGRSVPGFDLVDALGGLSEHLLGYGGHAAAAGLEIAESELERFARGLAETAGQSLGAVAGARPVKIDAAVSAGDLDLGLAEELERLGPFGVGNPGPALLVPGATVAEQRTMGNGDRHSSFTLVSGGHRARGVAFGRSRLEVGDGERADLAVRLERNEWRGRTEPRVRLQELVPVPESEPDGGYRPEIDDEEWWQRFLRATWAPFAAPEAGREAPAGAVLRDRVPRRPGSAIAVATELLLGGEEVLVLTADAGRRAGLALGPGGLSRFCEGEAEVVSARDGVERIRRGLTAGARCVVADFRALELAATVCDRRHVIEVDPPASEAEARFSRCAGSAGGVCHFTWGEAEAEFARRVWEERHDLAPALRTTFAAIREAGELSGQAARRTLEGAGARPRDPELCGRLVAVLTELELVRVEGEAAAGLIGVVSSEVVDLRESKTFLEATARLEKGREFLDRARHPHAPAVPRAPAESATQAG